MVWVGFRLEVTRDAILPLPLHRKAAAMASQLYPRGATLGFITSPWSVETRLKGRFEKFTAIKFGDILIRPMVLREILAEIMARRVRFMLACVFLRLKRDEEI